jgi:nitrous oxidase accessory protein NosD
MLMHSFMVSLLNQAERVMPSLTPEGLFDPHPTLKPHPLP